jgi:hypothetical protein
VDVAFVSGCCLFELAELGWTRLALGALALELSVGFSFLEGTLGAGDLLSAFCFLYFAQRVAPLCIGRSLESGDSVCLALFALGLSALEDLARNSLL